jgi:hypothetical protein
MRVYRHIHRLLQERAAECYDLWRLLGIEIAKREGEPPRRWGFMEIRVREPGGAPRDGRSMARQTKAARLATGLKILANSRGRLKRAAGHSDL